MSVTLKRWPPQVPHAGDFWGKHEARIWTQRIPRESLGYPGVRCLRKGQNDNTELNISSTSNLWYIRLSQSWCFGRKTLIRLSRHEAIRTEVFGFAFQSANVIFSFFGGDASQFCILYTETSKTIYQRDAENPQTLMLPLRNASICHFKINTK